MAATDGLGTCKRCGHALTGVRYWSDLIRPVCLRCTHGTRPRLTGWKEAAEANHRATLHKIAAMDEDDEDDKAEMPLRVHTIAVAPRDAVLPCPEPPPPNGRVLGVRDRLKARRSTERP